MTVRIRPATPADLPIIAHLIEEIERFYGATTVQPLEERITQTQQALFDVPPLAYTLLAETPDGDLLGLAAYSYLWPAAGSTHSIFLKELFVRQPARRQGTATALMAALRTLAAERPGCTRVEWLTDRDNPDARAFYRALGVSELDSKIVYRVNADE